MVRFGTTRPSHAAHRCSQALSKCCLARYLLLCKLPSQIPEWAYATVMDGGKHFICNLQGIESLGLQVLSGGDFSLRVYPQGEGAQGSHSQNSVSRFWFTCSGEVIISRSKSQTVVAQSSSEAEFVPVAVCMREVLWFKSLKIYLPAYWRRRLLARCSI